MHRPSLTACAVALSLAATVGFATGCSGSDDESGAAPQVPATSTPRTEPPPSEPGNPPADGGPGADSGAPGDASTPPPKPKNAFEGAPAYTAKSGTTTRQAGHSFNGNTPKSNPAGKACLNCHGVGGGAPTFAAAGTIYEGLAPAASVEVRAIDANGKAWSAYTNADGNFFFPEATQPVAFPALIGARNGTATELMATAAPKGNCNECHSVAGGAGKITVAP